MSKVSRQLPLLLIVTMMLIDHFFHNHFLLGYRSTRNLTSSEIMFAQTLTTWLANGKDFNDGRRQTKDTGTDVIHTSAWRQAHFLDRGME